MIRWSLNILIHNSAENFQVWERKRELSNFPTRAQRESKSYTLLFHYTSYCLSYHFERGLRVWNTLFFVGSCRARSFSHLHQKWNFLHQKFCALEKIFSIFRFAKKTSKQGKNSDYETIVIRRQLTSDSGGDIQLNRKAVLFMFPFANSVLLYFNENKSSIVPYKVWI